jgi:hypothetical protein
LVLFTSSKIKFVRPDGSIGEQPGYGNALLGMGAVACSALRRSGLGHCVTVDKSAVPSARTREPAQMTLLDRVEVGT